MKWRELFKFSEWIGFGVHRLWMVAKSIRVLSISPRTDVLGHSQPSLRD
jgi:hypothetical protein